MVEAADGKALLRRPHGREALAAGRRPAAGARAAALFTEDGEVVSAELLTKAPLEIQTRPVPLWRVEFEGAWRPTFYISPFTGELVVRRHDLWRTFDFVWMLHIMDYDDRQDVNNVLIRVFTWIAVRHRAHRRLAPALQLPPQAAGTGRPRHDLVAPCS